MLGWQVIEDQERVAIFAAIGTPSHPTSCPAPRSMPLRAQSKQLSTSPYDAGLSPYRYGPQRRLAGAVAWATGREGGEVYANISKVTPEAWAMPPEN